MITITGVSCTYCSGAVAAVIKIWLGFLRERACEEGNGMYLKDSGITFISGGRTNLALALNGPHPTLADAELLTAWK